MADKVDPGFWAEGDVIDPAPDLERGHILRTISRIVEEKMGPRQFDAAVLEIVRQAENGEIVRRERRA